MDAEYETVGSGTTRVTGSATSRATGSGIGSGTLGAAAITRGGVGGFESTAVPVSPSSRRQKIREPCRLMRMHCRTPSNHLLHLWQRRSPDTHHLPVSVSAPRK